MTLFVTPLIRKMTKEANQGSGITLPKSKIKAKSLSPNNLIIFSKPKVGKTSLLAQLDDALLLDLENGSAYVEALKMQIKNIADLKAVGEEIKNQGNPYKYIILDTITALEGMCVPYAETLYAKTPMGKKWFKRDATGQLTGDSGKVQYGEILNLPNGAGYKYLRDAVTKIIEYVKTLAPRVILVGHVKDVLLDKSGAEFSAKDLSLTGKIKDILSAQSDAIGYLYRNPKKDENILSFRASGDAVTCGARPAHLRNQEIVVSEMTDDGLVTHWDKIFID